MKTAPLSLAVVLAFTGCASDRTGDDDNGEGSGSGSNEPQPQPDPILDITGTYRLNSQFDIATNMPGNAGDFVNDLIDATNSPDDPMSWLVDQMLEQMAPGTIKDILVGAKPFVIGYLNDRITSLAPDLVGTIDELGDRMNDLTKNLGVDEKLAVNVVDQVHLSRVTVDGVRFLVDGNTIPLVFADYDIDDLIVDGVLVTYEKTDSRFRINEHTLPMPYGKLVRLGLDVAIIPAIDPNADSLTDLLDNVVNCQAVGQSVADALNFGSASLYAGACVAGLGKVADEIYGKIAAADSKLDMKIKGEARTVDSNNDWKLDRLTSGKWAGNMTYAGETGELAQPATFVGERLSGGVF